MRFAEGKNTVVVAGAIDGDDDGDDESTEDRLG
jgi:hypothetical protein